MLDPDEPWWLDYAIIVVIAIAPILFVITLARVIRQCVVGAVELFKGDK